MARTARKKVGVEDEGISIIDDVDVFDFVGAGVGVTDSGGGEATVTIPGGGTSITVNNVTSGGTTHQLDDFEITLRQAAFSVTTGMLDPTDVPSKSYLETQLRIIRNNFYQLGL